MPWFLEEHLALFSKTGCLWVKAKSPGCISKSTAIRLGSDSQAQRSQLLHL